jgi:hypothetical protein
MTMIGAITGRVLAEPICDRPLAELRRDTAEPLAARQGEHQSLVVPRRRQQLARPRSAWVRQVRILLSENAPGATFAGRWGAVANVVGIVLAQSAVR